MPPANEVLGAPLGADGFAARLERLGPFAPKPRLAAGVSGGADSFSLALLAADWVRPRGGFLLGLIVDHGLRPQAATEARLTAERLRAAGIDARILVLHGLLPGPGLAARARAARLAALAAACASESIVDLLLGHHAADQAETLMMRALSGSGPDGFAGILAQRHTTGLRLLRPLLDVPPARLRAVLRARGLDWIEDPSNTDQAALRNRLRGISAIGASALAAAAQTAAARRAEREDATASWLAAHAKIRPEGFAVIPAAALPAPALAALVQMVAGSAYPPAAASVRALAAAPRPATLGGARLLPAGRFGPGLLIVREAAALAPRQPAAAGALWDGRFRLLDTPAPGLSVGAIGAAAAGLRKRSALPAAVLASLPALWRDEILAALPSLMYRPGMHAPAARFLFDPPRPAACAPVIGA